MIENRLILSVWEFPKPLICECPIPIPDQTEWQLKKWLGSRLRKPYKVLYHSKQNEIMKVIVTAYYREENKDKFKNS